MDAPFPRATSGTVRFRSLFAHRLGFLKATCRVVFRKHLSGGPGKCRRAHAIWGRAGYQCGPVHLHGQTYSRRLISKHEKPFNNRLSVGCLLLHAMVVLGMLHVGPHR